MFNRIFKTFSKDNTETKNDTQRARGVIFIDVDFTILTNSPDFDNAVDNKNLKLTNYVYDHFVEFVQVAIKMKIELYIITARPDCEHNRKAIPLIITLADGFHKGIGGFKENSICFADYKASTIESIYLEKFK